MNQKPFSRIIAGTMTWGIWGKNCDKTQMIELVDCCLRNEINSFDHADIYGDYTTEAAVGNALLESRVDRSDIRLISKCGIQMMSEQRRTTIKHYDYSASHIISSVEGSLRNLQTDYLDLLLLHRPSPLMRPSEISAAVEKLKAEGKILDFGVSNFTPSQIDLISTAAKVNFNQFQFSVTNCEAMFDGTLDYLQKSGISSMCWSPMGSVFTSNDEKSQRVRRNATDLSLKYGVPVEVILLAWIIKHPAGVIPVCGTANPERISGLMKATTLDLELQDWFSLLTASIGEPVP